MAKITLIHGCAEDYALSADMILTDPPFEMRGKRLADILSRYHSNHLVLITTMKQLVELLGSSDWSLSFDFVLDAVSPKKSMSTKQPNYTHQTGAYLTRNSAASVFDRKRRQRSDVFEANGYWPTIIRAPREALADHGMSKNQSAITDLLGSFDISSVVDPFAGRGTTGMAAFELGLDCTMIEKDPVHCETIRSTFKFLGI